MASRISHFLAPSQRLTIAIPPLGDRFLRPALSALLLVAVLAVTARARADTAPQAATADSLGAASTARETDSIRSQLRAGRFDVADSAARGLLSRTESERGRSSLETARAIDLVVEVVSKAGKGKHAEAIALAERAVRIKRDILGPSHLELATSLVLLGSARIDAGNYAEAGEPLERALAIREQLLEPDHLDIAFSLDQLGVLRKATGDLEQSRRLYERALGIRERRLPPDDPKLANSLNNIAGILTDLGEYEKAQVFYERTVALYEAASGKNDLKVALALGNLGRLQYRRGDLMSARISLERALSIYDKNSAGERREAAFAQNQLALVLQETGDLWGAKERFERALAIRLKALGPDHPILAITLTNFADLLIEMGDLSQARVFLFRALRIREASLGPDHLNVAATLQSLANLLRDEGERAAARPLYERAIAIWEKAYGPRHHITAQPIGNLAQLEREEGHPLESRSLYERARSIEEAALGTGHPDVAITLEGLSRALADLGEDSLSIATALRCESISRDNFRLTCRGLSENEGLQYAINRPSGLAIALSLLDAHPDRAADAASVWDAVVRSRALVLDEIAQRHRSYASPGDTSMSRLLGVFTEANRRLARLLVEGPDEDHPERYQRSVDAARREVDAAERALGERSHAFRRQILGSGTGIAEASAALPVGSALVAYVRYVRPHRAPRLLDSIPESRYLAFVRSGPSATVRVVPLGGAAPVEAALARWKEEASRGILRPGRTSRQAERDYRRAAERLRKMIWDPLAKACSEAERVFIVPDGALSLVSFDVLPSGRGYLVEASPRFHYLSTERDLCQLGDPSNAHRDRLVAIGGPAFNHRGLFASLTPGTGARSTVKLPDSGSPQITYRGTRSGCGEFSSVRFDPLPSARREVEEIAALWRSGTEARIASGNPAALPEDAVVNLRGAAASESAFKAAAPEATVLHVATHGFFLGSLCPSTLDALRGIGRVVVEEPQKLAKSKKPKPTKQGPKPSTRTRENPLLLTGLALAGANHRESAGPFEEDGILTAEEIAALNLSAVRCAVLSACETGAGRTQAGEGVLGLRRAFQVAGAEALIMSLWGVEDRAARAWMRSFYENRYVRRHPIDTSVRDADLTLIGSRRRAGQSTHPFYWGAFVAAGDWR